MRKRSIVLGLALVAGALAARPAAAQTYDWQYKWYWGVKGGMVSYSLPTVGTVNNPQFGGEWVVTARRTALYVGFSTSPTAEQDNFFLSKVSGGPYQIAFNGMRRIQIGVIVFPTNGNLQPYAGAGFVIETLTNATYTGAGTPSTALVNAINNAASGGFALVTAGVQYRVGRKAALYAQYQGSPQGRDFLLAGSSNSFEAGLRYAFLPSREDDVSGQH